jgi:S-adenosylmethionine:tRNA ribosyltransferase-isomerase
MPHTGELFVRGLDPVSGFRLTDIFIYPGYRFKCMERSRNEFHLPESTLIMQVSALAGREKVLAAYETAIKKVPVFFLRRRHVYS